MFLNILIIYFALVAVVALRLGAHMLFKLDHYDWHYSKEEIWIGFFFVSLFWLVLIGKPSWLFDPGKLFAGSYNQAGNARQRDELRKNPPSCGALIRYVPTAGAFHELCGEFLFESVDVHRALRERIDANPSLNDYDEAAIFNWVNRRDESIAHPTDVPRIWEHFSFVANDLLRERKGQARCLICNSDIALVDILQKDDDPRPGWNLERITCPEGHVLLAVKGMHVLLADE